MKRFLLPCCLSLLLCGVAEAQLNNLKPKDFEPLTSLPWKDDDSLDHVLDRIFREPDLRIRYPVLAEYLRQIPVSQFGKAFDACVVLEGTQQPDALVSFFLYIWAKRDPIAAWEKTKTLFRLVGNQGDWLSFGYWNNPPIAVQDQIALQVSRYWISEGTLTTFVIGCASSTLPKDEKARLLNAFEMAYVARFKVGSGVDGASVYGGGYSAETPRELLSMLNAPVDKEVSLESYKSEADSSWLQIAWRRWLMKHPDQADQLFQAIHTAISDELLLVWRAANAKAMQAWAENNAQSEDSDLVNRVRCILISDVDTELRKRWLKAMLGGDEKEAIENLRMLARWEPQIAMESAALITSERLTLGTLVDSITRGPFIILASNTTHSGIAYLAEHELEHLSAPLRKQLLLGWFESTFLEQWGDIDIGLTARFGLHTLLKDNLFSREELIKMFSGKEDGDLDDGLVDRTFCALRVWAVVRPEEMREWITTQPGADLREALTWMLEHPWGHPKDASK